MPRSLPAGFALAMWLAAALTGCGGGGLAIPPANVHPDGSGHALHDPVCGKNPKDGVHAADRLKVLSPCAVFQGRVTQAAVKNSDGDVSFEVSPDPGYASMLNAHNRSEGGLHVEIVPRDQPGCTPGQPVHAGDIPDLGLCSGRDVARPALGARIRIIGPWVLDRNNGWYEIHPVWSITAAGCRVPRVIGRTLRKARAAVARSLCSVGTTSRRHARKRLEGHVIAQRPHAGSLLPAHARVNLTIGVRGR